MKEIKFRAFVKDIKKVFPVHSLELTDLEDEPVEVASCGNVNCGTCTDFYDLEQVELMQYTGLKDFVGTEIYDGDIGWDAHQEVYGKVVFEDGGFHYSWTNISDDLFEVCEDIEIVGNVFENPELLEAHHES